VLDSTSTGAKSEKRKEVSMDRDESVEQPTKDLGPDPLSGRGSGEEDGSHESEREAEEEVIREEKSD
jgi:hypothetical protein